MICGCAAILIEFIDKVVLKKSHKESLRREARAWLKTVEHYDSLQLALVCAVKVNGALDRAFGRSLLSRKMVMRGSRISTCLLVITLALIGLINKEPFGFVPWRYYKDSVTAMLAILDSVFSQSMFNYMRQVDLTQPGPFYRNTNAFVVNLNSNYFLCEVKTNAITSFTRMEPFAHGTLLVAYSRVGNVTDTPQSSTNMFGKVTLPTTAVDDLEKYGRALRADVKNHDKPTYIGLYSVLYFIILFAVNAALFICSLVLCRVVLREIALCGRLIPAASLVALNLIIVLVVSCVVLSAFAILTMPLLWYFIHFIITASDRSIYTLTVLFVISSFSLWCAAGISAKLVALISLLPAICGAMLGLLAVMLMRWKKVVHYIVKEALIRCVEANPIVVGLATVLFVSAVLAFVAKCLHLSAFL
jgi:hypothetical protein